MAIATTTRTAYDRSFSGNPAANYETYFVPVIGRPFGADLVEGAGLRPGEDVLDVACGTGIIARLAAQRVAPNGTISALDANAAMLDVARSIPSVLPIRWYETPAESVPLPDRSFDVVFCGLGLQFFAQRAAALREMHRVLRPGGRVHITTPMPSPFFDVLDREIERHFGREAAGFVHAVFSLNDREELRNLLTGAGFETPDVEPNSRPLQLPAAREFMWQYIHSTPLMALLAQSRAEDRDALERAVVAGWQSWAADEGMTHEQSVLIASAVRPS